MIETLQYITKEFLLLRGFSVGIIDVIPTDNLRKAKKKILDKSQKNINQTINQSILGILSKK